MSTRVDVSLYLGGPSVPESSSSIDPGEYRRVLGHFPTGVVIVTSTGEDRPAGVAIGSFASVSIDPPLVGFFLGTSSASGKVIASAGGFCVNILGAEQKELCGVMASKSDTKFEGVDWQPTGGSGAPILPGILGHIDCEIHQVIPTGDHDLFLGRVLSLEASGESSPMVFFGGNYGTFS